MFLSNSKVKVAVLLQKLGSSQCQNSKQPSEKKITGTCTLIYVTRLASCMQNFRSVGCIVFEIRLREAGQNALKFTFEKRSRKDFCETSCLIAQR